MLSMKKFFAVFILCLILIPAWAQELPEESAPQYSRNEIGLSVTSGTTLQATAFSVGALASLIGSLIKNDLYIVIPAPVPVSLEYDHWFNDRIALGVCLNTDIISCLPKFALGNVSIMPDLKVSLYHNEKIRFYSKIAAGYSTTVWCYNDGEKVQYGTVPTSELLAQMGLSSLNKSTLIAFMLFPPFGFQFNPVCMDVSTAVKNLDFFCEFGFGTQGACALGFKMLF